MLKSKCPLSRSLRNDTGLVTKRLDVKTFLRANRHAIMPIESYKRVQLDFSFKPQRNEKSDIQFL